MYLAPPRNGGTDRENRFTKKAENRKSKNRNRQPFHKESPPRHIVETQNFGCDWVNTKDGQARTPGLLTCGVYIRHHNYSMKSPRASVRGANTLRRRASLACLLALSLRGDSFHSRCPAHVLCSSSRALSHPRGVVRRRAGSGGETREEPAGQGEVGVPDTLRDVVVEAIEELGGGRVLQVRKHVKCSSCLLLALATC